VNVATVRQEQYIEFRIGEENYAIRIEHIHEIIRLQTITPLPHSKPYVKGVINLRGHVVPVISLRRLFGMADDTDTKSTRIVVIKHLEQSVGVRVDLVNKVTLYPVVQPPPERIGDLSGAFFTGIGVREGELVGLLNLDEVLLRD
jgi:purine-binding chemotaxis protein CheW